MAACRKHARNAHGAAYAACATARLNLRRQNAHQAANAAMVGWRRRFVKRRLRHGRRAGASSGMRCSRNVGGPGYPFTRYHAPRGAIIVGGAAGERRQTGRDVPPALARVLRACAFWPSIASTGDGGIRARIERHQRRRFVRVAALRQAAGVAAAPSRVWRQHMCGAAATGRRAIITLHRRLRKQRATWYRAGGASLKIFARVKTAAAWRPQRACLSLSCCAAPVRINSL